MELPSPPYLAWGWRIVLYLFDAKALDLSPIAEEWQVWLVAPKAFFFFFSCFLYLPLLIFFALKCFSNFGWKPWFFAPCGCATIDWEEESSWTYKFLSFLLKIPTLPALRCNWNYALTEICFLMGVASPSVYCLWALGQNTHAYSVDWSFQNRLWRF